MVGKADGVVPTEHDRHDALLRDVRHCLADLVERLLQVARDGEHVADVDDVELLAEIDAGLVVVCAEEVGRPPDSLRAEPGAGPVGGARVERHAEDRDLGVVDLVDVLDERTFQERAAFAREVRLLAADERRDGPVVDGRRGLEAEAQAALDLLAEAAFGRLASACWAQAPSRFRGSSLVTGAPQAPSCRCLRRTSSGTSGSCSSWQRSANPPPGLQRAVNTARASP